MRYLVTGTAGFIGYHVAAHLLAEGHEVVGIDGFTPYYDVNLKHRRHAMLEKNAGFTGYRAMLEDKLELDRIWSLHEIDIVIHLAAQAGVRYSLENPRAYIDGNLVGTFNVMELVRERPVKHFLFASTSSVYGANASVPFRETDQTDHPLTIYAASKKANEVMAHCYAHLWNIPTTAFRFFTVYGPWGRPDMALFKFTKGILEGAPIDIYNFGKMERDFTYVADLVKAVALLADRPPGPKAGPDDSSHSPVAPFRVVNIGPGTPVSLMSFIEAIEAATGREAIRNYMAMQPGDVPRTFASPDLLVSLTGYRPDTSVAVGVPAFVDWYRDYYKA
jgi:UDP-glucuronate 4-epimerase